MTADRGHRPVLPSAAHLFSSHKYQWCSWSCGRSCQTGCSRSYPALGPAMRDRQTQGGVCISLHFAYIAGIKVLSSMELQECAQSVNQMMNWICFNKRCSFMVMRGLDLSELCAKISGGRGRRVSLRSLPFSLSLSIFITLSLAISASLLLAFSLVISMPLSPSLCPPPTVFRALSMSMPWLQGTAGLARQSPALPRRETSTRWRRRYLKASAITRIASWVRAEVYCTKQTDKKTPKNKKQNSRTQ